MNGPTPGTKRLFYGAYQQWGADTNPADGNRTGVGMAEMHTDRFACLTNLDPAYPGQLTTKPVNITATSCRLTVNADTNTSVDAELTVELLSRTGYRLHGYDQSSAVTIKGVNGVAVPLLWGGAPTPPPSAKTSCEQAVKSCATMHGDWRPWPCKADTDCSSIEGTHVTCGGVSPVCVAQRSNHTCFSRAYDAPLCVEHGAPAPAPPGPPPSGRLPAGNSEVMLRAHLNGGARLYAFNLECG